MDSMRLTLYVGWVEQGETQQMRQRGIKVYQYFLLVVGFRSTQPNLQVKIIEFMFQGTGKKRNDFTPATKHCADKQADDLCAIFGF